MECPYGRAAVRIFSMNSAMADPLIQRATSKEMCRYHVGKNRGRCPIRPSSEA